VTPGPLPCCPGTTCGVVRWHTCAPRCRPSGPPCRPPSTPSRDQQKEWTVRTEQTERRQLRPRLSLHLHLRVLLPLFAPYRPPAKLRRRDTATAAAKKRAKGSGRRPRAWTTTTTTGTTRSSRKRWPRRPACGWNKRRVLARRYTTQRGSFPSPSAKGYWRIAAFYYKYVYASKVLASFSHDGGVLRRAVRYCPVPQGQIELIDDCFRHMDAETTSASPPATSVPANGEAQVDS